MLPDAEDGPAETAQGAVHLPVAGPVGGVLVAPELRITLGLDEVPRAAVPKAAVHEHRGLQFWKNKVRPARKLGSSSPSRDVIRPENLYQPQLGGPVAAATDPRHQIRPLCLCKAVCHIFSVVCHTHMALATQRAAR